MAMLSRFKLFLATLACLYLFDFPLVSCARFGSKATTLHFPSKTAEDKFRNSEHVLQYDGSGFPAGQQAKQVLREKRKAAGESTTVTPTPTTGHPPPDVTFVHMNDSHHQLIVLWAGQGSDVLVALARDIAQNNQSTSRVFISYDYGLTFEERIGPGKAVGAGMIINHFYNSPVVSSHYVFTDTVHNATLSTQDYGRSFKRHDCPFRPTQISMHSENSDFILGMDEKDPAKRLWISEDFGSTWSILQYRVKSYFWGVTPYDAADTIYVEREDPSGLSTVFRFEDYLTTDQMVVMKNVVDFEVRDKYMFATRKVNLLGARNETLQLWVSYDRGPFLRAIFPGNLRELDYYIPDASEDQVFVCVNHEGIRTHLYISNVQGTSFTLSMEDILYFNPEGAGKDTWVSLFLDETFADFHKVEGLRGVYIASQVKNGSFSMDNTITLITFDKGGLWDRLQPPRFDNHGNRIDCDMSKNCSLHLTQRFAQLSQTSQDMRILSKESAPGLILATGTIGTSLKRDSLVFVSTTGGVTWYQILDAHYFFTFADHGGVIVAARQFAKTNELKYSWNFGKTWETYLLGDEMHIYGILTEPGEKTTIFTLFGSKIDAHQWILVKIDMAPVLGRNCTDEDYKLWTASDDRTTDACLLGRRTTYQRRQTFARCYNGRDYDRPITSSNCSCTREDFECDVGHVINVSTDECVPYTRIASVKTHSGATRCHEGKFAAVSKGSVGYTENTYNECIANDYVAFDSGLGSCPEGLIVPHTRGYRRVPGDTCEGGQIDVYAPKMVPCEVKPVKEFMLFANRTKITRVNMLDNSTFTLPLLDTDNVIAVEYDFVDNCVYWTDIVNDKIMRLCMDGHSTQEVIVEESLDVMESLAFDWISRNLYWVEAGSSGGGGSSSAGRGIWMVAVWGSFEQRYRTLVINETFVDQPRALVVDPVGGMMYWTDWSAKHPRIMKAWLDGSHVNKVVEGTGVHWPNGLALDHATQKLYWTDAYEDCIMTASTSGEHVTVLIKGDATPHPFAISLYKGKLYWDDWYKSGIFSAQMSDGANINPLRQGIDSLMDLEIFDNNTRQGTNQCSESFHNCTHICVGLPNNGYTCLCPGNMTIGPKRECMCAAGQVEGSSGHCVEASPCDPESEFRCVVSGSCLPMSWYCDGDNDCGDMSDETNCTHGSCGNPATQFQCRTTGRCVPSSWTCDFDRDCPDGSDEEGCSSDYVPQCAAMQFRCVAPPRRCVPTTWMCDLDRDCADGSDEANCTYGEGNATTEAPPGSCEPSQFRCDAGSCIPMSWQCDGDIDCPDGSDEANCTHVTCNDYQFLCANHQCIYASYVCDGDDDCRDGSDEQNCSSTTTPSTSQASPSSCGPTELQCRTAACVPLSWKCDGVDDCGDGSDEEECGDWTQTYNSTTCSTVEFRCNDGNCIGHDLLCNGVADCPDSSDEDYWMCRHSEHNTTTAAPATCDPIQFRCEEGTSPQCILGAFVCDKEKDCKNGEDEKDCPEGGMCQGEMFPCLFSAGCLSNDQLCDGHKDCIDGSDEVFCDKVNFTAPTCPTGQTQCVDGSECIDVFRWCDGHIDCLDSSDEDSEKCKGLESQSIHVGYIQVDRKSVTNSSFLLLWEPPSNRHGFDITYKPSIRLQGGEWMNYTNQRGNSFRFRNLLPNTQYEASVSVNATHAGHSHLHALYEPYSNVLTSDGCPTAPLNVTVSQPEGIDNTVRVVWKEPLSPNGLISTYKVYYTPPVPEMVETSGVNRMVTYMYVKNLKSTETYTFQVAAVNEAHTVSGIACVGPRSEAVKFRFQEAPISQVTGAKEEVGMTTSTSVSLIWDAVKVPVKGYKVIYVQDGIIDIVMTTTQTKLTVDGLSPGIKYVFKVYAYRDEGHFQEAGPETFVEVTTKGKSLKAPRQLVANTVNATSVELMWKAPANDTTAWTYGISYGVNEHRLLLRGERARTSATSIVLKHLVSCEDYIFKVRVVGPTGKGPFSNAALSRTEFDVLSHPKKLAWEHLTNVTSVNVTWLASCDIVKKPLGYVVRIADKQDPSKPSSFTLPQTTAAFNNFTLVNLIRGATYAVTMKTNVLGARWTNPLEIDIAAYPAPTEVKAVLTLGGVLELSWRAPAEMPAGMGYAIWVAEGDGNLTHRYTAPPGNEFDFPATMQLGRFYRFAVSVDRVSGHYGQLSRTYEADIHPHGYAGSEDAHESSMLYRVVLPSLGVVIALLVVGMVIFWMKHRRLRRSFLAFANSHYDTRSGTTTFSTDLGGDDEEDSPMIRGFADDEPLVIA